MTMITTTDQLEQAVAALSQSDFVTVDTEFIRETTFWPELCVIQLRIARSYRHHRRAGAGP